MAIPKTQPPFEPADRASPTASVTILPTRQSVRDPSEVTGHGAEFPSRESASAEAFVVSIAPPCGDPVTRVQHLVNGGEVRIAVRISELDPIECGHQLQCGRRVLVSEWMGEHHQRTGLGKQLSTALEPGDLTSHVARTAVRDKLIERSLKIQVDIGMVRDSSGNVRPAETRSDVQTELDAQSVLDAVDDPSSAFDTVRVEAIDLPLEGRGRRETVAKEVDRLGGIHPEFDPVNNRDPRSASDGRLVGVKAVVVRHRHSPQAGTSGRERDAFWGKLAVGDGRMEMEVGVEV